MNILISGTGIAGPTLAYWLQRYGHKPTLLEKAPALRRGGYVIDFWGTGYDVAEKMGILPELKSRGYEVREVRIVDRVGKKVSGFPASAIGALVGGRFTSLPRGELAAVLYESLGGKVETLFGQSLAALEQDEKRVRATFEGGETRDFDLVVGADGLHSRVRELAFGPQERYEKFLGYKVAAFEAEGYEPRDELVYVMFTEPGQMLGRFTLRGNRTLFLFIFADRGVTEGHDPAAQRALLERRYGGSGWECPRILEALRKAPEFYYDRLSQVRMDPGEGLWSRGRVALVGDAAFCVSLLAGQGSALAMTAAYVLAGEIHLSGGDHALAFRRYQEKLGAFIVGKQRAASRFGGAFAPRTRLGLFFRNQVMKLLGIRFVADQAIRRDLTDRITLPDY